MGVSATMEEIGGWDGDWRWWR